MGCYSTHIFPRLCDLILGRPFVAKHRRELLTSVQGDILEIGFGTGLNLECYPPSIRKLTTVDPNPGMHALARRRIQRSPIRVDQQMLSGEELPFTDATFDCVVSTFTLCSIAKVDAALHEVQRVLKPGGRFLFLEHGLSPDPAVARWQHRLNWLEMRLADGCRLNRDIRSLVNAERFAAVTIDEYYMNSIPKTHGYMSRGIATK